MEIQPNLNNRFDEDQPDKVSINSVKNSEIGGKAPLEVIRIPIRWVLIILVMPLVWSVVMALLWGCLHRLGVDDVLVSHVLLEVLKIWANTAIELWKILISGLLAHLFDGGIMLW